MKTIINIGEVIFNTLSNDEELKKIICDNIYPIVAMRDGNNRNDRFPFITYSRSSGLIENKDTFQDNAQIEIQINSNKYSESIEIAELVREIILKIKGIQKNDYDIQRVVLMQTTEDFNYDNGAFVQIILFNIVLNNR